MRGSALPRRAAAKCAAPGLPSPGVRALHVTRVGGGLPARWAETKQRRTEQEGDPRLPQSLLQRKRSREANGVGRCTVQTRLLQAGYKTGAGRSDLGNRHAPTRTGGAWPPGVKRRRCLFRTTTRKSASPLLPAPFAPETRRRPFRENRSPRPAPPRPTTGGAPARGALWRRRGPRPLPPGGAVSRSSAGRGGGGPVAPPGGSAPALRLEGPCPCSLGAGRGPLDFGGEEDALPPAVRGGDGLQLQEVQQHLDLRGGAGGAGGSEREAPSPPRTQGPSQQKDRQAGRVLGAPAKSRGGSRGPPSPPLSASWPCPLTSATSPAWLGGSHWRDTGYGGCGGGQAEATGPGPVGEATVPGT